MTRESWLQKLSPNSASLGVPRSHAITAQAIGAGEILSAKASKKAVPTSLFLALPAQG